MKTGKLAQSFKALMIAVGVGALGWSSTQAQGDEIALTWHGQATTVLKTKGDLLLIDAFFVQSASIAPLPTRGEVEARHGGGVLKLILLTHGHADHFGVALQLLEAGPAPSCIPDQPAEPLLPLLGANSELVRNLVALKLVGDPCRVIDWNKGGKLTPGGIIQLGQLVPPLSGTFPTIGEISEITMVPAEHSSSLTVEGVARNGGEAVGYIIRFRNGFTLYHAGDTYVFDDMHTLGERHDIDLAVLPIGGNFTMDPVDAAFAAVELIKPRFVIPVHYSAGAQRGFSPALVGTPEEFVEAIGPRRDIEVIVPKRGDTVIFRGAGRTATAEVLRVE